MNSLLALLIRHGLAACSGFFIAHNICADSTTSIIVGLLMLYIATVWSWAAKLLHLEDEKGSLINVNCLRPLIGAIVSQLVTAASTYFAIDANNPELFGVAVINAAASKFGLQQKLAHLGSRGALKLLFFAPCVWLMVSCDTLRDLAIKNAPLIEEGIVYGVRSGVQAGFKKLKIDAKQPRENVQPSGNQEQGTKNAEPAPCLEPRGDDSVQRCLQITVVPFSTAAYAMQGETVLPVGITGHETKRRVEIPLYGARVADALRYPSPLRSVPNCAACHAGSNTRPTGNPAHCPAPALMAR